MSENTSTRWGYLSCDDGHYLICTDRVPVTDTPKFARVIGTAKDKDTAVLMAAAPEMYEELDYVLGCLYDIKSIVPECINRLEDLLAEIEGKEAD